MARTPEHDSQFIGWVRFTSNANAPPSDVTHKKQVSAPVKQAGVGTHQVSISDNGIDILDARIAVNIESGGVGGCLSVHVARIQDTVYEITQRDAAGLLVDGGTYSIHWERLPQP